MKVVHFLVALMLLLGINTVSAQQRQNTREAQVVFSVDMDCHNCEQKVKKNIPYQRGVKDLTTNLDKQLVTIKYQTNRTDKDKLKKSIEKLGFKAEEVKPQQ